jgi:hypothetical protein
METMEVNEDFYSVLTTVNKTVGLTYQPKNNSLQLSGIILLIKNSDIFPLISLGDIVGINEWTMIQKIINQCDIKHILI